MPSGVYPRKSFESRFWGYVNKQDVCWLWAGYINEETGYGRFTVDGLPRGAHVVALELRLGRRLMPGLQALHTCRNRHCVRHVYEGSPTQNQHDRLRDGTDNRGSKHHAAILNEDDVRYIRKQERRPGLYNDLAEQFGVTRFTINMVRSRYLWAHVED